MDPHLESLIRRAANDARVINFGGGLPAEAQFPKRALAHAFLTSLERQGTPALQYGWAEGTQPLRQWVVERLAARGASVTEEQVIITSGAQQAIALSLELLCKPGDTVGVDEATYPAALDLMRERHLRPRATWNEVRARYAMPALSNPLGRAASAEERRDLLQGKVPIIEDDAYAELRFDGEVPRPLLADFPARVLHVGTLSKTLSPGLRIGWLVMPTRLRARALRLKASQDLQASSLAQSIVEEYLVRRPHASDERARRLERLRRFYRARAHKLRRALLRHLPAWRFTDPEGGFAIWALAPEGVAVGELAFLRAALDEGVCFDPGSSFRADRASAPLALRLCFSAAPTDRFEDGAARLAIAWRRVTSALSDVGRRRRPRPSAKRAAA